MKQTQQGWPIGLCTWSLGGTLQEINGAMNELGLRHVHLAIGPALADNGTAYLDAARQFDWTITSTMIGFPQEDYSTLESIRLTGGIVPDAYWAANRAATLAAIDATASLGVPYLSLHAGFLDAEDPARAAALSDRLRELADAAAEQHVTLLLESGQESADDLRAFMERLQHPALGINFDPANMILYNKDNPIDAVAILAPWIRHVHIKDAVRTQVPGEWGSEVPWGDGEVGPRAFLEALQAAGFSGAVAIEREAGTERLADMQTATQRLI